MDSGQILAFLEAGGLRLPPTDEGDGRPSVPENVLPKYNGLSDPAGAETLCRALAGKLLGLELDVILIWEDAEDVVLAHIIGRELDVPAVRAFNADGLVGHVGELSASSRVLLLSDAFRDPVVLQAMSALVAQRSGTVVAHAALVDTEVAHTAQGTSLGSSVSLLRLAHEAPEL